MKDKKVHRLEKSSISTSIKEIITMINGIKRVVNGLTKARSLFRLRNTSCFLIDLRLAISLGSSKACSMASATYPALPYWKSLMDASAGRVAPSSTRAGV